ncbi:MAG: pilus assembly protein PilM [Nitrospinota bacterium]
MKSVFLEKSLGIDIREDSVALTLIGKKLRMAEVLAGEFIELKLLTGKDEKAEKHFLNQVNKFLIENNSWPESVVVSLPRSLIMFKTFELPAPDIKTVQSMVDFELERHFSSGLENLYYTYQLNPKPGNVFHVASAAIKKEIADYYLELIHKLNLKPTILDVSTFINANLTIPVQPKDTGVSALADISPRALDIVLIKNGIIEFSRSQTWDNLKGNNAFPTKDASPGSIEKLSEAISQKVVEELEQALSSCQKIEENETVDQIYIFGGGPLASQITNNIENETEVSTILFDAPDSVTPASSQSFSASHMMTALGLALSGLKIQKIQTNLLPNDLRPKRSKSNPKTSLALAATIVLCIGGWIGSQIYYNNKTLNSLDNQLKEIKGEVASLEKIDLEHISIQQYVDILNAIDKQYPAKLPLLDRLSQSLPRDTWLTNIKFEKGEMEIKGFSPAASKLVPLIEKSPSFKKTGFVGSIIRESIGEKFTIRAKLEPQL